MCSQYSFNVASRNPMPRLRRTMLVKSSVLAIALVATTSCWSANKKEETPWSGRVGINYGTGSFNSGDLRGQDNMGLRLHINHSTGAGIMLGYDRRSNDYNDTASGSAQTPRAALGLDSKSREKTTMLSAKLAYPDEQSGGKIVGRIDWLRNTSGFQGLGTRVLGGGISLQKDDATTMLDILYHRSKYDDQTKVTQWAPAFSFMINQQEWAQLRYYNTRVSGSSRYTDNKRLNAFEVKFVQSLSGSGWLLPDQLQITYLRGERRYTVDPDSFMLYTTGDLQTSGFGISGQWPFYQNVTIKGGLQIDQFEAQNLTDSEKTKYTRRYVYVGANYNW